MKNLNLTRVYFDVKGKIDSFEVIRETEEALVVWTDETPKPLPKKLYKNKTGGFWATEAEAAANASNRLKGYIKECEKEVKIFDKIADGYEIEYT
jgi:hypothetical protein